LCNFPRLEFPFCVLKTSNLSSERLMFRPNVWLFPVLAIMVASRRTENKFTNPHGTTPTHRRKHDRPNRTFKHQHVCYEVIKTMP
jgi:hypothetical protein